MIVQMVGGRIRARPQVALLPLDPLYPGLYSPTLEFTAAAPVPAREGDEGTHGLGGCHHHPRRSLGIRPYLNELTALRF